MGTCTAAAAGGDTAAAGADDYVRRKEDENCDSTVAKSGCVDKFRCGVASGGLADLGAAMASSMGGAAPKV